MTNSVGAPVAAGLAVGVGFVVLFSFIVPMTGSGNLPDNVDNAVITMERSVCFGACPAYSVIIFGNGAVTYNGFNFVEVTGERTYKISQEDVKELVSEFYEADYFSLKDEYTAQVTDLPTTVTSIKIDGREKQVIDYYGAPEKLKQLEDKIDEIANTKPLVKGE